MQITSNIYYNDANAFSLQRLKIFNISKKYKSMNRILNDYVVKYMYSGLNYEIKMSGCAEIFLKLKQ